MYSTGTHFKKWTFKDKSVLSDLRTAANQEYIKNYKSNIESLPKFLSVAEERTLCKYYEGMMWDFCRKFNIPMPKSVISCSFHYFKRFYLKNSVMDYHPKHLLATCIFLACKVEEFNVSMMSFIKNIRGDRAKANEVILSHELLLMGQLEYNLVIHHPYRPIEGFLIDIKTRCPEFFDPEYLRPAIDEFLDTICMTDAFLLYSPSQIALAAVAYSSSKSDESFIESYIQDVLLKDMDETKAMQLLDVISNIQTMVRNVESSVPKDQVKYIEKKLEGCWNEANNPTSDAYKRRRVELQEEDELEQARKYVRLAEKQEREDQELLRTTLIDQ